MRITCPSCHAIYEVPDALLGDAHKVRCARCAFEWTPQSAAAQPRPPPPRLRPDLRLERMARAEPQPPLPAPLVEREAPPSLRARSRPIPALASIAAVATSVLVLIAFGWAAYAWRAEVMQAWPPSQRLFAALGLQ